jgi:hypothetical protein
MIGLLELNGRAEEGLRRLQARIAAESRPRRVLRRPGGRPALRALAALFLVTLGLSWRLAPGLLPDPGLTGAIALARPLDVEAVKHPGSRFMKGAGGKATYTLDLGGETPAAFREQLRAAAGTADLPRPPRVDLTLDLRNGGTEPLRLWLDPRHATLTLDLEGPGTVTVAAHDPAFRAFDPARVVVLAPGQTYHLPITRLASGPAGAPRYAYWTKPGEYTLTARLCTLVCRGESGPGYCAYRTIVGPPVTLDVRRTSARPPSN